MLDDFKAKEDANRARINEHRARTKNNIECQKKTVFDGNKGTRSEIKLQQNKIRETIQMNKLKQAQDKQKNFAEIYEIKRRAKETRMSHD